MDPITGALIAAGISGIFGMTNQAFANKYNTPKSQLKRLRKAGLPLSYMYQGKVNQQSSVPSLSIDPDLGTVESFKASQQLKTDQAALDKIAVETDILKAERDVKQGERDWMKSISDIDSEFNFAKPITNQESLLNIRHAQAMVERFTKEHEQVLKGIFAGVESKLFDEDVQVNERKEGLDRIRKQISNLVTQNKLMNQLHDIRSMEQMINTTITDNIEDMPALAQAFWSLLMKLFSKTGGR